MSVYIINEDNELEDEPSPTGGASSSQPLTEASQALLQFWPRVTKEITSIQNLDVRNQALPLARIKKIMKLDEEVKMISGEAPVLFAKAAELFIQELTLRSWVHTEDNKRRTLQRNDIAMAVTKYDQFDFLIDIVPRDEAKPAQSNWRSSLSADQVHYYFQMNQQQQQQQALQGQEVATVAPQVISQPIQTITQEDPKNTLGNANIQLVQQIISPATGEIQQVPVQLSQNQLNMIRMQLQAANPSTPQPIIISPQIIQVTQGGTNTGGGPVYIQTAAAPSNS